MLAESDRLLLIEGKPDRLPHADEPLKDWLKGRWGSYRGLEVDRLGILRAFVDPWCSRPLFYRIHRGTVCVADKLATIVRNSPGCEVDWGTAFEAMLLGSAYSGGVTIDGAVGFRPGQMIRFGADSAAVESCESIPLDSSLNESRIQQNPSGTLLDALGRAVNETWDSDAHLLLSGGLDSRFCLVLAGPGRRTMTVTDSRNRECVTAERIAEICGAEFRHWQRSPEHQYARVLREAPWITGAMYDSITAHHLGMGNEWRSQGIDSIAHAFLFDTLFKGYFLVPEVWRKLANPITSPVLGPRLAGVLQDRFQRWVTAPDDSLALLSSEGRSIALEHLKSRTAPAFRYRSRAGLDETLECRVAEFICRQPHYPILLVWMDEVSVCSPIFHPALWTWFRFASVQERFAGRAFRRALLSLSHPAIQDVADSSTGMPVNATKTGWKDLARRMPGYGRFVNLLRDAPPPEPGPTSMDSEGSWPAMGAVARTPLVQEVLSEGLAHLEGNPLFDQGAIQSACTRLRNRADRYLEPVCGAVAAGFWASIVSTESSSKAPGTRRQFQFRSGRAPAT